MSLYPFTAIVDQERLVQALLVNAGRGRRPRGGPRYRQVDGRARLAELLPEIEVVADCPFSCDPADRAPPVGSGSLGERLGSHRRRVRVVDLPLNATEDRVAGSVDIARAPPRG